MCKPRPKMVVPSQRRDRRYSTAIDSQKMDNARCKPVFFVQGQAEEKKTIATKQTETTSVNSFKLVTYNYRNINTSKHAISQLLDLAEMILLQEHWLFDCQLCSLASICDSLTSTGKAVDTGDPILPVQII